MMVERLVFVLCMCMKYICSVLEGFGVTCIVRTSLLGLVRLKLLVAKVKIFIGHQDCSVVYILERVFMMEGWNVMAVYIEEKGRKLGVLGKASFGVIHIYMYRLVAGVGQSEVVTWQLFPSMNQSCHLAGLFPHGGSCPLM